MDESFSPLPDQNTWMEGSPFNIQAHINEWNPAPNNEMFPALPGILDFRTPSLEHALPFAPMMLEAATPPFSTSINAAALAKGISFTSDSAELRNTATGREWRMPCSRRFPSFYIGGSFSAAARIMEQALPKHAYIEKDAKECMHQCVTRFMILVTRKGTGWGLKPLSDFH